MCFDLKFNLNYSYYETKKLIFLIIVVLIKDK